MKVRVSDVMTTDVITIGSGTPLKDAAITMARHRVSGLPVVDEGALVGIVTESDFVARLASTDAGLMAVVFRRDTPELSGLVRDAMTPEPHVIEPHQSVAAAARLMTRHGVKRLPVVDSNGVLVGIVSRADLMSLFARPDDDIAADITAHGVEGLVGAGDTVQVRVTDGVVSLAGTVGTVTEKRMLEEYARNVAGVVRVESGLGASVDDTRLPPL